MIDCCMPNPSAGGNSRRALGIWRIYDTRRDRSLLERPTQSEVGSLLLLQGRSSSYSAAESQVDGLDDQCSPPERDSDIVALGCHFDRSNTHHGGQGSGEWHRAYYWCCSHHSCMLGMRLFVFTHEMRTLTPNEARACVKTPWRQVG